VLREVKRRYTKMSLQNPMPNLVKKPRTRTQYLSSKSIELPKLKKPATTKFWVPPKRKPKDESRARNSDKEMARLKREIEGIKGYR
jgi:hypothetical protein